MTTSKRVAVNGDASVEMNQDDIKRPSNKRLKRARAAYVKLAKLRREIAEVESTLTGSPLPRDIFIEWSVDMLWDAVALLDEGKQTRRAEALRTFIHTTF